jgi:hypothetical protein
VLRQESRKEDDEKVKPSDFEIEPDDSVYEQNGQHGDLIVPRVAVDETTILHRNLFNSEA